MELLMRCTWARPYWCRDGPRLCRAAAGQISGGSRCLVFCERDCAAAQRLHGRSGSARPCSSVQAAATRRRVGFNAHSTGTEAVAKAAGQARKWREGSFCRRRVTDGGRKGSAQTGDGAELVMRQTGGQSRLAVRAQCRDGVPQSVDGGAGVVVVAVVSPVARAGTSGRFTPRPWGARG
jgi:hypothetical protein